MRPHQTPHRRATWATVAAAIILVAFGAPAGGQEAVGSADEVAAQLANPNAVLGKMGFNFDYTAYAGDLPSAGDQSAFKLVFQPSLPYPTDRGFNVFVRPAVPIVITQDVPAADGFEGRGVDLGDIGFDAALGKSFASGMVLVGGVVGTLPTATDDALGRDQWMLGPELAVAKVGKAGVAGVLITHQWDVAGEDAYDTSITGGQYFLTYNLENAWQLTTSPSFSYDHEAPSGQRLTFPLGVGVAKTTVIGGRPWKLSTEYWHYIEHADAFGPGWQLRFTVTPVVPLPWG